MDWRALAGLALGVLTAMVSAASAAHAQEGRDPAQTAGQVASMLQLAATEYVDAVSGGRVINSAEYEEATAFTAQAARMFEALSGATGPGGPAARPATVAGVGELAVRAAAGIDTLQRIVREKGPPADYEALVARLVEALATGWGAVAVRLPEARPSAARGAALYRRHCASCHGASGRGDGPAATGLEPPPADLAADIRHAEATPARDFQVVSYGIPATAMAGWSDRLSLRERWDVVAYIQGLRFSAAQVAEGRSLALGDAGAAARSDGRHSDGRASPIAGSVRRLSGLERSAGLTDAELREQVERVWSAAPAASAAPAGPSAPAALTAPEARAVAAYLRTRLGTADEGLPPPDAGAAARERLAAVDSLIGVAATASARGDLEPARSAAIAAYMRFEGIEAELRARDAGLVASLESSFSEFRGALGTARMDAARARLEAGLRRAGERLATVQSAWAVGMQSFFIILREGFEAILIIGAIIAFLLKTGHGEHRKTVYAGVFAALGASAVTAVVLEGLFRAAPAKQEVLEGAAMLLAVVVLFWVSCWLISKLDHEKWERYLRTRMQTAIGAGGGIALASVSFLAVYREGFETILFYKALVGFAEGMIGPVIFGFLAGCAALALIYFLFTRYGIRIPLRPFFAVTSGVLYYMAIVFAGSGVRELQEAGVIGLTPVAGAPEIPLLGIYPTVETLAAQGLLVGLLVIALLYTFGPWRSETEDPGMARGGDAAARQPVAVPAAGRHTGGRRTTERHTARARATEGHASGGHATAEEVAGEARR